VESSLRQSVEGNRDDAFAWRLAGVAAAFATGWLAGLLAGRSGLTAEQKMQPSPEQLPTTVKLTSYALSSVAYPAVYLPVSLGMAALLAKRGVKHADAVPRSALAAWIAYHVVKSLVDRDRPPSEQGSANADRSYPSGHATAAAAIATSTAMLLSHDHRAPAADVLSASVGLPLLIGASRVVLGKHWPTDILGGFGTGIAIATHVTANRQKASVV
jgi:membrane-associated phospholipid phosphatase